MKSLNGVAVAALIAAVAAPAAFAQDAVQWRVEDGGNGHWYAVVSDSLTWTQARYTALIDGGHLATLTTDNETNFVLSALSGPLAECGNGNYWIGGFRNSAAEPWQWVTGEAFQEASWCPMEPSGTDGHVIQLRSCNRTIGWSATTEAGCRNPIDNAGLIIEWSADCDLNDTVDFEQILNGATEDHNHNNIPDDCEFTINATTVPPGPFGTSQGENNWFYLFDTGDPNTLTPMTLFTSECWSGLTGPTWAPACDNQCYFNLDLQQLHPNCPTSHAGLHAPTLRYVLPDSHVYHIGYELYLSAGTGVRVSLIIDGQLVTEIETLPSPHPSYAELFSSTWTALAAGTTVDLRIHPTRGCFGDAVQVQPVFTALDCDNDGLADPWPIDTYYDCDGNGISDTCDIGVFGAADCNHNLFPDSCELALNLATDCDGNGVPDTCDPDCDADGIVDACELLSGSADDCDDNGIPDSCDLALLAATDCNSNGSPDSCDVASGLEDDCDGNGIPDSCDPDCNLNGIPDACERLDQSADCNSNGVPDECDTDCNLNGIPDQCETLVTPSIDCNNNGVPDSCETNGDWYFDSDCDSDGVPDDCQIADDPSLDANGDGQLDVCQTAAGDFNLDRTVDSHDLATLISHWGLTGHSVCDLNSNGLVDGEDLGLLLLNWGGQQVPWGTVLEWHPDPDTVLGTAIAWQIIDSGLPWRVQDRLSDIELLLIPPGTFRMGCSPSEQSGCLPAESPRRYITLTSPWYLGRYEVQQSEWVNVMGSNPSNFQTTPDHMAKPVEMVSWEMAQSFLTQTMLRLPTEAEWEFACRAGSDSAFHNASDDEATLGAIAWFEGNSANNGTSVVGQKIANPFGLHDMHGNVFELVQDWYGQYQSDIAGTDPPGPLSGSGRVARGGSWAALPTWCRSSSRSYVSPLLQFNSLGFRVARTP